MTDGARNPATPAPVHARWRASREHRARIALWARLLGAVSILAVGVDHIEQYSVDSYSAIPTIGTLFLLNFVSPSRSRSDSRRRSAVWRGAGPTRCGLSLR